MYLLLHEDLVDAATTLHPATIGADGQLHCNFGHALTHADKLHSNLPHRNGGLERWAVPHPELQQCCKIEAQPADVSLPLQPLL